MGRCLPVIWGLKSKTVATKRRKDAQKTIRNLVIIIINNNKVKSRLPLSYLLYFQLYFPLLGLIEFLDAIDLEIFVLNALVGQALKTVQMVPELLQVDRVP